MRFFGVVSKWWTTTISQTPVAFWADLHAIGPELVTLKRRVPVSENPATIGTGPVLRLMMFGEQSAETFSRFQLG